MDEAEKMFQRALEGYEKALGPEHTSTLLIAKNLGNLYKDQSKMDEAERMPTGAGGNGALVARSTYIPSATSAVFTDLRARWRRRKDEQGKP